MPPLAPPALVLRRKVRPFLITAALLAAGSLALPTLRAWAQSLASPWNGYGHDPQHTAISSTPMQSLNRIKWQTPVDLAPQYNGNALFAHYGSPLITALNTVVVPVKTGASDGFKVEGRSGTDGSLLWTQTTDYSLPPHNWVPTFGMTLGLKSKLFLPGAGGGVYYRTNADSASSATGALYFYGTSNFNAAPATYRSNVKISTPITSDRYGNVYFGFSVSGANPLNLKSGLARISYTNTGTWVAAATLANDVNIDHICFNAAPALSNDQKTLYVPVTDTSGHGYLLSLNSQTLAQTGRVRLTDPRGGDATLIDDGTAAPAVGPDGDVYYGTLEASLGSHGLRGWLLHFSGDLTQTKTPGSFGWDDTPSIVPTSMIPSYAGSSTYLVMTKYNNYVQAGGDGANKIAVLDPNATQADPRSGASVQVMKEVLAMTGPTPDPEFLATHPAAVREWCINTAAVDPATNSILVNNEDGILYRWDLTTNRLTESIRLTPGIGEAYTPTAIGVDGTVYGINNATLFAVGQ